MKSQVKTRPHCQPALANQRYAKLNSTVAAFEAVQELINAPGASGRNSVDYALASKVSLAMYLQEQWGGRPNKPPPVKDYDRDARWRARNFGEKGGKGSGK